MANIQIGKYDRPAIYTEEYDNSLIETPIVPDTVRAMVIGVSKKGPVNTPVELRNINDMERIFGSLDRSLESKESYFHRSILNVLNSGVPVIAMNLLATDDALDILEYKSISTSTSVLNAPVKTDSYRKFFNTTGFWNRSTESFLNVVKDDAGNTDRILHFTNMSDRKITVFLVKTKRTDYNVTLLDWYGAVEKIPTYLNATDYVSDYMVDVLVVAGDFTNYDKLAVDKTWSKYFNRSGLRKEQFNNFLNEKNLTVLKYYEALSMIPYFRGINNNNLFIENNINNDTDVTGLFCSFDIDMFETDAPNGLVDLVGNNLITGEISEIEYLSYKETISENISIVETPLDKLGNVIAFGSKVASTKSVYRPSSPLFDDRTAFFANNYTNDIAFGGTTSLVSGTFTAATLSFITASPSSTVIYNNVLVDVPSVSIVLTPSQYTVSSGVGGATQSFTETIVINSSGIIKNNPTSEELSNGIVLGTVDVVVKRDSATPSIQYISSTKYNPVSVTTTGYNELSVGANSGYDVQVSGTGTLTVTYTFTNTAGSVLPTDVVRYRRIKMFNALATQLSSANKNKMSMLLGTSFSTAYKQSLADVTVTVVNSSLLDKSITLAFASPVVGADTALLSDGMVLYLLDDEFVVGTDKVVTKKTKVTASEGVVGKYSSLYTKYVDGIVNTGDYFYENLISSSMSVKFFDNSGDDYIAFSSAMTFNSNDKVLIPESTLNNGIVTIIDPVANTTLEVGYFAYKINENTTTETVSNVTKVFSANAEDKHYIKPYLISGNLTVEFVDSTLSSVSATNNTSLDIRSQKSNFRQTVEIEYPTGYVFEPNKILIDGARYTEVKIGDFLEAVVPVDVEGTPKYITRIISKKVNPLYPSFIELTTDSEIKKVEYNGDYQTQAFGSVDSFITTYKGVVLNGFKVREASLPNGSEDRQKLILSRVAKGTNLFNALTDRENISFRYLVDSFGLGLTEFSKQELADICGERLDVFGFINMPSMKTFKNSQNPTFVDSEGVLQTSLISQGGDQEANPSFLYSFAQGNGVSCVGYFTPYVTVNDAGRPKNVPPSSFVANTFLRKFTSNLSTVTPWTVCAGITDGRILGIAGVEMPFSPQDISNLNRMKANPIVPKNNRGFNIETENTAQTLVTSALTFIHVREVLIELEKDLRNMLMNFQWKYNTPEVRGEIKYRADQICEKYSSRSGIYAFFNKIDLENNTTEMIDNQIGLLQTYVEPIKALATIVNQVTIDKTGGIASSGFVG